MSDTKITVGVLIFTILIATGVIYVSFMDKAQIRVDDDKTTFYVKEGSQWRVSGREYNKLFSANTLVPRILSEINVSSTIQENFAEIKRKTAFKRNAVIIDTYAFLPENQEIEYFPVSHQVRILNGSGLYYRYEVRDVVYDGPTVKLSGETILSFGRNMKVMLHPGYRWAYIYSNGVVRAQYDIKSNDETFTVRLFDPPTPSSRLYLYEDGINASRTYELGTTANITMVTNSSGPYKLCLSSTDESFGTNFSCRTILPYCYQENISSIPSCIASNEGELSINSSEWANSAYLYDGNWNTCSHRTAGDAYYFVNYSIPSGYQSSSLWQARIATNKLNLSVSGCSPTDGKMVLALRSYGGDAYAYCYNSAGDEWIELHHNTTNATICEEAMWFAVNGTLVKYLQQNMSARNFTGNKKEVNFSVGTGLNSWFSVFAPYSKMSEYVRYSLGLSSIPTNNSLNKYYGEWTNMDRAGDGVWTTYGYAVSPNLEMYRNISFTGSSGTINWTFKYSGADGQSVLFNCYNYTSGTYVQLYAVDCSTDPSETKSIIIPQNCVLYNQAKLKVTSCQQSYYYEANITNSTNNYEKVYANGVSIDIFNDSVVDMVFPGELRGTTTYIDRFSNGASSENISFVSSGATIRYLNVSTYSPGELNPYNVTMNISGYTIDTESVYYKDSLWNTSYIDTRLSTGNLPLRPEFVYDDFSAGEVSGRWDGDYSVTHNQYVLGTASATGYGSCPAFGETTDTAEFTNADYDLSDSNQIVLKYMLSASGSCQSPSCSQNNNADGNAQYGLKDSMGNTYLIDNARAGCGATYTSRSGSEVKTGQDTIQFRDDGYIWVDNVQKWAYNPSREYYLWAYTDATGDGSTASGSAITRFYYINMSGYTHVYGKNLTYRNNTEAMLISTNTTTDTNISRAILTVSGQGTGTPTYYLSNNNGTTWEQTTSGAIHSFSAPNNTLKVKINVSSPINSSPYIINWYSLSVTPGTIENLSIDIGNDAVPDYSLNGTVNESNSPLILSLSNEGIIDYITSTCTKTSCLIPISFSVDKAGTLEYVGIKYRQNLSSIQINTSAIHAYLKANYSKPYKNYSLPSGSGAGWYHLDTNESFTNYYNTTSPPGVLINKVSITTGYRPGTTALSFENKSNNYVRIGNRTDYSDVCVNGCSFVAWIMDTDADGEGTIISRYDDTNDDRFFKLATTNGEDALFRVFANGTAVGYCEATNTGQNIVLNTWEMITGTYNLTHIAVYENGTLIDTSPCTFTINQTAWNNNEATYIGMSDESSLTSDWTGRIADVLIYKRALTPTEVNSLYVSMANSFVRERTFDTTIPYGIQSAGQGNLTVKDLRTEYLGDGSTTLTAKLYNSSRSLIKQVVKGITYRHSPFNVSYPPGVEYYDIFPSSYNAKLVQPFGQKNGTPIFNITSLSKTSDIDVVVCLNESVDDCLNISWSSEYSRTPALNIHRTEQCLHLANLSESLKGGNSDGYYNWWNLTYCSTDAFRFLEYNLFFDSWCDECVRVN